MLFMAIIRRSDGKWYCPGNDKSFETARQAIDCFAFRKNHLSKETLAQTIPTILHRGATRIPA